MTARIESVPARDRALVEAREAGLDRRTAAEVVDALIDPHCGKPRDLCPCAKWRAEQVRVAREERLAAVQARIAVSALSRSAA